MFTDPRKPVVGVTWFEAVGLLRLAGNQTGESFRLPTEAEWERAARGGREGALFPWGDEPPNDRSMVGCDSETGGPAPVGVNPPNDFGLYDMSEGVHEWCSDFLRLQLLSLFSGAQSPGCGFRRAARIARRLLAPSDQVRPLRGAQLAAAEFQIFGLRFSGGGDDRKLNSFKPFK